ncbi:hypothetical protein MPSYJ_28670 [Mycolicibacterium psychrotolerans]|uniref:Uncharacterized protein n=2 Tax=Mycolicibacterium psychrotolerans TaxID=216929 RepID=A0A7I7MBE2_9MYCO|nr:hypothetical protein MPSYJ_28670 [Mycolicibacterium psychrotolerans]
MLISLATPFVGWRIESRKLDRAEESDKLRALREHRQALVKEWREGLHDAHTQAFDRQQADSPPPARGALVGHPWFESLRPLLDLTETQIFQLDYGFADEENVVLLAEEISRIERVWGLV